MTLKKLPVTRYSPVNIKYFSDFALQTFNFKNTLEMMSRGDTEATRKILSSWPGMPDRQIKEYEENVQKISDFVVKQYDENMQEINKALNEYVIRSGYHGIPNKYVNKNSYGQHRIPNFAKQLDKLERKFHQNAYSKLLRDIEHFASNSISAHEHSPAFAAELLELLTNIIDIAVLFPEKMGISVTSRNTKQMTRTFSHVLYQILAHSYPETENICNKINNYFESFAKYSHQEAAKRAKLFGPALGRATVSQHMPYALLKFLAPYTRKGLFQEVRIDEDKRHQLEIAAAKANGKTIRSFSVNNYTPPSEDILLAAVKQNPAVYRDITWCFGGGESLSIPKSVRDEALRRDPHHIFSGMDTSREQVVESIARDGRIMYKENRVWGQNTTYELSAVGKYLQKYPLSEDEMTRIFKIREEIKKDVVTLKIDFENFREASNASPLEPESVPGFKRR